MKLFDKKTCAVCGGEAGRIAFVFKTDKQCLCKNCSSKLPDDEFKSYAKKNWSVDYFTNSYLPFLEINEERRKNFKLKAWYGPLFIDEKNRQFCFSNDMAFTKSTEIPENTPIFKFDEISQETMIYFDTFDEKSGLFGYTLKGDVKLMLICDNPDFYIEGILRRDLTINMKNKEVFLKFPKDLEKVHDLFYILLGKEEVIPPNRRNNK